MSEDSELTIHCEQHGFSHYCVICQHLMNGKGLGFYVIEAEPEEPAQAWCDACDEVLRAEQGWTDRADEAAGWALLCTTCFEETLDRHAIRDVIEGTSPED